ncbi:E3 ubiquitin-protein ligase RFWD3-like isoform X2 [Zophobas morio]|uniref:E3 ubiquitin-protein ligase RFWD3-like isoform X2 n=1 Tax=Zophobas morio TaxID=2755281 RepID=UPI0030826F0F
MLLTEQAVLHSTPEDFSNNTENIIGERTNSITEASSVRNVPGEEIISKTTSSQEKGKDFQKNLKRTSRAKEYISKDDIDSCSICLQNFTSSGNHRPFVSPCGHVFGENCLKMWVVERKQRTCPLCKCKVNIKRCITIRGISKGLLLCDKSELEDLKRKYKDLKLQKFESDCKAFDLQQRLEGLRTQSELLQREVERLQRSAINSLSVKCVGSVTVSLNRMARVMTLAPHRQDTVAVSSEVFGDRERWGVSLLDLSVGGTTRTTLSVVHEGVIRDLKFQPSSAHLLTVSLDKTAKIFDVRASSQPLRICFGQKAWSCAWSAYNPNVFYAGLAGGLVESYDMRNLADPLLKEQTNRSSVVALYSFANRSLVAAGIHGVQYYRQESGLLKAQLLNPANNETLKGCTCASVGGDESIIIVTYRGGASRPSPYVYHVGFSIARLQLAHPVYQLTAYDTKRTVLSRSTLFIKDCAPYFCTGNESAESVDIWDLGRRRVVSSLKISENSAPFLDLKAWESPTYHILASLTASTLYISKIERPEPKSPNY